MKVLSTDKTTPIYKGSGQQMYPAISGDLVVWQDSRNGDFDIYVKDLVNGTETKLTGDGDQLYPDISGYTISWQDATTGDISYYFWDKKWGKTYPREGEQTNPVVSGNYIAYVDGSGEDTSIRKLDLASWKDELVQAGPGQARPPNYGLLSRLARPGGPLLHAARRHRYKSRQKKPFLPWKRVFFPLASACQWESVVFAGKNLFPTRTTQHGNCKKSSGNHSPSSQEGRCARQEADP